ncbi:MAG: trigger factor [Parabacteroides sp.]
MNVSLKNIDATKGIMKLEIVKADYADKLERSLRNLRQKANIPGFRKGMVPIGMIKRMYGKNALLEEVNQLVSESLYNYIRENNINILGEPLPNETEQPKIDFDTQEDFEFCFDVAFAPEIKIELTKDDELPFYKVVIDDETLNKQIESYRLNFGSYDSVDDVDDKSLLKGTVAELENGAPKEGGILVESTTLMPMYVKNETEKAKFLDAKKNSVITFNPKNAFDGSEVEISSFLHIDKAAVQNVSDEFSFEIKEITRNKPAELNQEFFDKVFGKDTVKSVDEFEAKITSTILEQYEPQSNFKFLTDARNLLVTKVGKLEFADEVLKRWLLMSNDKNTKESIEADYPHVIEDLTYQLIRAKLVKDNDIKIENKDIEAFAKQVAKAQFAQYGMLSVPEDALANYAQNLLKDKQTQQRIADRAVEDKLADWLKSQVSLNVKEVSAEEFNKLFEA